MEEKFKEPKTVGDVFPEKLLVLFGDKRKEIEELDLEISLERRGSVMIPIETIAKVLGIPFNDFRNQMLLAGPCSVEEERYRKVNCLVSVFCHKLKENFPEFPLKNQEKVLLTFHKDLVKEILIPEELLNYHLLRCKEDGVVDKCDLSFYWNKRDFSILIREISKRCGAPEDVIVNMALNSLIV